MQPACSSECAEHCGNVRMIVAPPYMYTSLYAFLYSTILDFHLSVFTFEVITPLYLLIFLYY